MSKMSEFPVITNPVGFYVPLFTPDSGGLNRRGLLQKLGLPYVLDQGAVAASVGATTDETTLATITVPAGAMGPNGLLRVKTLWSFTNSANNKNLRWRLGGTAFLDATQTTNASYQDRREVHNRNSQSSQVGWAANATAGGGGASTLAVTTAAINTAADTTLLITGQKASAGETLTLEAYLVEVMYKE